MSLKAPSHPRLLQLLLGVWLITGLSTAALTAAHASSIPVLRPQAADRHELSIPNEVAWAQRARVSRGAVVRGPRGGVAAGRRTAVVRGGRRPAAVAPVRRPVVVAPGWRRPASYYWRPGGAIAAGAAVGFVGAAAAAAYAGNPPVPGYCWYYTDPQQTQGFWDACPQ